VLSPANSNKAAYDMLESRAKRVIFNPGAENAALAAQLTGKNIEVINACTLAMLTTGQF
jgi:CoA binding domain